MTPHTQAFLHNPAAGVRGDCYRTAVACLLDVPRDDVPHVNEDDQVAARSVLNGYLARHGLLIMEMPLQAGTLNEIRDFMAAANPGVEYLLSGTSPRGTDHMVVVPALEPVWDPHPTHSGLTGPCADGFWWIGALVARRS